MTKCKKCGETYGNHRSAMCRIDGNIHEWVSIKDAIKELDKTIPAGVVLCRNTPTDDKARIETAWMLAANDLAKSFHGLLSLEEFLKLALPIFVAGYNANDGYPAAHAAALSQSVDERKACGVDEVVERHCPNCDVDVSIVVHTNHACVGSLLKHIGTEGGAPTEDFTEQWYEARPQPYNRRAK